MNKLEQKMLEAIHSKSSVTLGNTRVEFFPALETMLHSRMETSKIYLYGNQIACYCHSEPHTGKVIPTASTLIRHPARTTVSRLRALSVNARLSRGTIGINQEPIL